jgi:hypothetical protein
MAVLRHHLNPFYKINRLKSLYYRGAPGPPQAKISLTQIFLNVPGQRFAIEIYELYSRY